jgi:hypothetical protein
LTGIFWVGEAVLAWSQFNLQNEQTIFQQIYVLLGWWSGLQTLAIGCLLAVIAKRAR